MIRIHPAWGGENAEDVWALYYYLLYQVFPFAPDNYLPMDGCNAYYYEYGDRNGKKIYPKKPRVNFSCNEKTIKELNSLKNGTKASSSLEEFIRFVSTDLHNYLYDDNGNVSRKHLRTLLTTQTDEATLSCSSFDFQLSSDLMNNENEKSNSKRISNLLLTKVFRYDSFSRQKLFPKLIQMLSVSVCPYCNRAFTTTVRKKNGEYHRQNQIDHYRSKARYPWFALTLPNFVPACANCNQKKGSDEKFVLYPYEDEFGSDFFFRTKPLSGIGYLIGQTKANDEFSVEIIETTFEDTPNAKKLHNRANASIEKFGLSELYAQSHNDYVSRIFEQRYVFGDAYIDSLINSFPDYFHSREDLRELLYLKKYDESSLDEAPLAKLTHDIDQEITEL